MNSYPLSLDKSAQVVSAIMVAVLLGTAALGLYSIAKPSALNGMIPVSLLLATTILGCQLFRPLRYELGENGLVIVRPMKPLTIPYHEMETVSQLPDEDMRRSIRIFGVGGLFGYFGKFYNSRQGSMNWYASRRGNYVMLGLKSGKKVVLTPDDPSGMAAELEKLAGLA